MRMRSCDGCEKYFSGDSPSRCRTNAGDEFMPRGDCVLNPISALLLNHRQRRPVAALYSFSYQPLP